VYRQASRQEAHTELIFWRMPSTTWLIVQSVARSPFAFVDSLDSLLMLSVERIA